MHTPLEELSLYKERFVLMSHVCTVRLVGFLPTSIKSTTQINNETTNNFAACNLPSDIHLNRVILVWAYLMMENGFFFLLLTKFKD